MDDHPRSALPFAVLLLLVAGVWLAGLLPTPREPSRTREAGAVTPAAPPHHELRVALGTASELAADIARAPRALVFVDAPWSFDAVKGRQLFFDAAARLAQEHAALGVRFFRLRDTYDDDCIEWIRSLKDDRLPPLGDPRGSGRLIWLEWGRVVDVEPDGGKLLSAPPVIERSLKLWPR